MKNLLVIIVVLALALVLPQSREKIVDMASGLWKRTFSTMQERSTISAEARKEELLRRSQLQETSAPTVNPLRSVSAELQGMRQGSY